MLAQARRSQQPIAMLMMDLDHFKKVNDAYGHLVGDACLQHVAQRMQQRMRNNDLLVRFPAVRSLPPYSVIPIRQAPWTSLEQLRTDLAEHPCLHQDLRIDLSLSIGVYALIPDASSNREQLLRHADEALYRAKAAGRNRVEAYDASALDGR